MSTREALLGALAGGEVRSGSALAASLGLSRAAVWKQVRRLRELGLDIHAVAGHGYRLAHPLDLLDRSRIMSGLAAAARLACESLEVAGVISSTSAALVAAPAPAAGSWRCLLAEYQTAGRGRRGRRWLSPYGGGLCLSLAWSFAAAPRDLPALSLAAGVAACRTLAVVGAGPVQLKWPNDVLLGGAKLAGILVDVDGDARGPLRAVVGLGLNLVVPAGLRQDVVDDGGMAPVELDPAVVAAMGGRNALAAALIGSMHGVLAGFAVDGFAPLAEEWRRHDYLCGRPVTITTGAARIAGIAAGIAADGALLVEGPEGIGAVYAGDVTLRDGS